MINKLEAIKIGQAIVAGAKEEKQKCDDNTMRYHINGALIYALDNLWIDVFNNKVRSYFNHDKEKFCIEVWELL